MRLVKELSKKLFEEGCIKFGEFKLTSGITSPIYIDLRVLPSKPDLFKWIVDLLIKEASKLRFDAVCGIETASIPLASVIGYVLEKPMIYVRKEAKSHGLKRLIEGSYAEGWRILLVDDVATTGGSLLRAVRALRDSDLMVEEAIVVIDRGQGASKRLSSEGVELRSLAKLIQLVDSLRQLGLISESTYRNVTEYLGEWSD